MSFGNAKFSNSTVGFGDAVFSGGTMDFNGAVFSGGTMDFNGAAFSGGIVDFSGVFGFAVPPRFGFRTGAVPAGVLLPGSPDPAGTP